MEYRCKYCGFECDNKYYMSFHEKICSVKENDIVDFKYIDWAYDRINVKTLSDCNPYDNYGCNVYYGYCDKLKNKNIIVSNLEFCGYNGDVIKSDKDVVFIDDFVKTNNIDYDYLKIFLRFKAKYDNTKITILDYMETVKEIKNLKKDDIFNLETSCLLYNPSYNK